MMAARRRRGTGTIEPMADGRFRPRLPGNGERLPICETEEEAALLLDVALGEIREGALRPGTSTLAMWGLEVLDTREKHGIRGIKTERSRWKTHVDASALGQKPFREIERGDAQWGSGG